MCNCEIYVYSLQFISILAFRPQARTSVTHVQIIDFHNEVQNITYQSSTQRDIYQFQFILPSKD